MKSNIYFESVENIGDLQLEYIFCEFEMEPILFMCSDKDSTLYLCLCSEIRNEQKWVISKCSIETLKSLIDEQIDIVTAMHLQQNMYIVELDLSGKEKSYNIESSKVDLLDLPEEGVYLRCDKEKARDYLWSKELLALLKKRDILKNKLIDEEMVNLYRYSVAINEPITIIPKQLELYTDSISKTFFKQLERINATSRDNMIIKNEYSIILEKNKENDLNNTFDDDYIQAA